MVEVLVIGPSATDHRDHSVCIFVDQIWILGDLAPPVFDRRQIFDTVALDHHEQSLEPFASGRAVRRRDRY
jgi:hypothetical protein